MDRKRRRTDRPSAGADNRVASALHLAANRTRRAFATARRLLATFLAAMGRVVRRAERAVLLLYHRLRAWLDRIGPRGRAWLLGTGIALLVAAPLHFTLAREPELAAIPVNILHRAGLTAWRARPYDDLRQMPYHVTEVETDDLPVGTREVDEDGRPGLKRVTGIVFESPRAADQRQVTDHVIRAPRDAHVRVGTGRFVEVMGHRYDFTRVLHLTATAYDFGWVSNGRWTGKPSRLGVPLGPGIAAVDPDVIPLGTWLYVSGYGMALAADTGSAIKGNRIDLFLDLSPQEVRAFGIRPVTVYVLDLPKVPPVKAP